ncbi:MAG: TonB-dependent receptor [Pedobacter sp.]|nr:MAG: TonB-dependent receptor [Pedobacter sp.]
MKRKSILILFGLLCFAMSTYAQRTIRGKVTEANGGTPISGASVTVKDGNGVGTNTQSDGSFTLNVPASGKVLVISYIGFTSKEVTLTSSNELTVSLEESSQTLESVMIVAYGTVKKDSYTGSAAVISNKNIKDVPVTSFENALTGRVAGVQVTSSSGQAGATSAIRIRGIGSMNASNEPLYVIDGVPVVSGNAGQMSDYTMATNNVMSTINPADIESITILKDAAASSLYGSRAANGVVIINTKRGKSGKPLITFKSSVGLTPSWATDNYETAGIQEQTNMLYRIFHDVRTSAGQSEAAGNTYALTQLNNRFNRHGYKFTTPGTSLAENVVISGMTDGLVNREGSYFDWEDALFRTATFQTNDLAVSGGDQNTTYYSSLSYTRDQSRVRINDFDRISGRVNLNQKVGKYVEFLTNVNFARSGQSGFNDTRNTGSNYFMQSRNLLWPFYWPTDYKTGQPFTARYGSLAQNTVFYDNEWENSSVTKRITANETVTINFLPELNLKSIFSYDNAQVSDHIYYSPTHYNGAVTRGIVNELTTNTSKLVSSTTLNFNKQMGLHNIGLLAGFEAEENKTEFQRATGQDLPSSTLHTVATAGVLTASAYDWGNSMVSALSRAEYNYNQKYFLSGSFRRDGSAKLGPTVRWGNFYSIGGAWRLINEDFIKNIPYISNLRLRASYGVNGTLPLSNFGWRFLTGYTAKYISQPGGNITGIPDPNLNWETSYSSNIALEFGLFNNRISGTVEYFNRDSKGLLQEVPISMVTGFSSTLTNVGEINNKGLEIDLGGDIIRKDGLRWSASINASFIRSTMTKLYSNGTTPAGQDIIWYDPSGGDSRAQFIYREGQPTFSLYGYEWAGVHPQTGKNVWYMNNSSPGDFQFNGRPATYAFRNASFTILGNAMPDVYGGINSDIEYKGITLAFNFNYKIGGKIYDGAYKDVADDGYYWERIRAKSYYDNMWTPSNTSGTLPKLDGNDLTDAIQYSSRQMHDASFLRLKNVTLGYSLPKKLIERAGASNARIYFNGSNLLTFSKYKNADPEVNEFGTRGWETPFGKTYTFGIELGF